MIQIGTTGIYLIEELVEGLTHFRLRVADAADPTSSIQGETTITPDHLAAAERSTSSDEIIQLGKFFFKPAAESSHLHIFETVDGLADGAKKFVRTIPGDAARILQALLFKAPAAPPTPVTAPPTAPPAPYPAQGGGGGVGPGTEHAVGGAGVGNGGGGGVGIMDSKTVSLKLGTATGGSGGSTAAPISEPDPIAQEAAKEIAGYEADAEEAVVDAEANLKQITDNAETLKAQAEEVILTSGQARQAAEVPAAPTEPTPATAPQDQPPADAPIQPTPESASQG